MALTLKLIKLYILTCACPVAIFANLLLAYLIKNYSPENLKNYVNVLILGVVTDTAFSTFQFIAQPTLLMHRGYYFIFLEGPFGPANDTVASWALPCFLFLDYFSILNPSVQFFVRYLLICRDIRLKLSMFLWIVAGGVLTCATFAVGWVYILLRREPETRTRAAQSLLSTEFVEEGVAVPHGSFDHDIVMRFGGIAIVVIVGSYGTITFCAISVYLKLKKVRNDFTPNLKRIQTQINIVLAVEAILPLVTLVLPTTLEVTLFILDVYSPRESRIAAIFMATTPLFNPLVKMAVMTPYRSVLLRWLTLGLLRNSVSMKPSAVSVSLEPPPLSANKIS